MVKAKRLDVESNYKDYSPSKMISGERDRLDVNDLLEKRKKEKIQDRRSNVVILSGATAVAAIVLLILYF